MDTLLKEIENTNPYKIVLSGGRGNYMKITAVRKLIRGKTVYQLEKYTRQQVFHENIDEEKLISTLQKYLEEGFRQLNSFSAEYEYDIKLSKKGKFSVNKRKAEGKLIRVEGNNRRKQYIFEEGMDIPVLKELGIFTKEGKIVHAMYDKYRQINRFVEMVDDILKNYHKTSINVIDFGCGKSYLTFVLYYYLVEVKKIETHITGLDLKEKVIADCNRLAEKFEYDNLHFELGNINGYETDEEIDMVVTLHACDTATDYALYNAIC